MPGPFGRPLIGNLPEVKELGMHEYCRQCSIKYGGVFKIWMGRTPWVCLADASIARYSHWKRAQRGAKMYFLINCFKLRSCKLD